MSTIKIHNWKVSEEDPSGEMVYIKPEYHIRYWEVPKWWYPGPTAVYASCVRVDLNDTSSIYIDGTTPLMQIELEWDGEKLKATNYRDIRRALICAKDNLGAINRDESDDYTDVEFFGDNYYIKRTDNYTPAPVLDPLTSQLKPTFYSDLPVSAGSSAPFDTGTWNGGLPPVTYEWRYKAQDYQSDQWYTVGDFVAQPNEAVQETLSLPEDSTAWYIHIESRAVDAEGTAVYNNSAYRRAIPKVSKEPGSVVKYSESNTYESGSVIRFQTGTFYGGIPPVQYRHRIQQKATPGDSWTNSAWTNYDNTIINAEETITFAAGGQCRIQCQAVDSSQGSVKSVQNSGSVKTIV